MIKKLFPVLLILTLLFGTMGSVMAKGSSRGSFSGGSRSYSTHSYSSGSSTSSGSKTYSSGVRRPSSSVSGSSSYQQPYSQSRTSSWGSFFGGMAAGSLLTSMFHPFGGGSYYGGGYGYSGGGGFSFFGLLFDLLLLYIGYRIVRRLFFRR